MSESKLFKKMSKASDKWGESNDCTVKAVAIATGVNYETAHGKCALRGRSYRKGLSESKMRWAMKDLDFVTEVVEGNHKMSPTLWRQKYNSSMTIGSMQRAGIIPKRGVYIVFTRSHVLCVRAGQIHDWTSGRRHRVTSVYHVRRKKQ
jgi:hypothetical protein